jgi:predicted nucleic acid-binding Zn finger protein
MSSHTDLHAFPLNGDFIWIQNDACRGFVNKREIYSRVGQARYALQVGLCFWCECPMRVLAVPMRGPHACAGGRHHSTARSGALGI